MSVVERDPAGSQRRGWKKPELRVVGTLGQVLAEGGGKNSPSPADPGESRKPKGQGGEK